MKTIVLESGDALRLPTAKEAALFAVPQTITDFGTAIDGDIVRQVSRGVVTKAQADSSSHAAYIVGVRSGSHVIPFASQPIVNFDSAPLPGPCYLSATVAGAGTSTAPNSDSISVPPDLIVLEDHSVDTTYKARVGRSASIVSPLSIEQQFVTDAAVLLGVQPTALRHQSKNFDALAATGYPDIGAISYAITPGSHLNTNCSPSTVDLSSTDGAYPQWEIQLAAPSAPAHLNILTNTPLSSQIWAFRTRVKAARLAETFKFYLDRGAGAETIGLGMVTVAAVDSFYLIYGNFSPLAVDPSPSQRILLIAEDTAWHVFTAWSIGDGSIRVRLDNGAVHTVALSANSVNPPRFFTVTTNSIFEYWMFAAVI